MVGKFYHEIAEELLSNKAIQEYRKELEKATSCFEESVNALFEAEKMDAFKNMPDLIPAEHAMRLIKERGKQDQEKTEEQEKMAKDIEPRGEEELDEDVRKIKQTKEIHFLFNKILYFLLFDHILVQANDLVESPAKREEYDDAGSAERFKFLFNPDSKKSITKDLYLHILASDKNSAYKKLKEEISSAPYLLSPEQKTKNKYRRLRKSVGAPEYKLNQQYGIPDLSKNETNESVKNEKSNTEYLEGNLGSQDKKKFIQYFVKNLLKIAQMDNITNTKSIKDAITSEISDEIDQVIKKSKSYKKDPEKFLLDFIDAFQERTREFFMTKLNSKNTANAIEKYSNLFNQLIGAFPKEKREAVEEILSGVDDIKKALNLQKDDEDKNAGLKDNVFYKILGIQET